MSTPTTEEAIGYARNLIPDCWSDEAIKVLLLDAEEWSSLARHYLRRAEKAEAELANEREKVKVLLAALENYKNCVIAGGTNPARAAIDTAMKEAELKQMQSSALTWARFAGDKAACADIAEQRAQITERLWKEFITLMDITEESDSGNEFNPNKISSCRAMDGKRLNEILNEARQIVFDTPKE